MLARTLVLPILRLLATTILTIKSVVAAGQYFGIQSNDGDSSSSFASSMVYHRDTKRIHVTGSTYGSFFGPGSDEATTTTTSDTTANNTKSNCFLGILQLPTRTGDTDPIWLRRVIVRGNPEASEACSYIHTEMEQKQQGYSNMNRIYLAGHTTSDRRTGWSMTGTTTTITAGMIRDMGWDGSVHGNSSFDSHRVQYPMSIQSDSQSSDIFMVSIISDSPSATILPPNSSDEQVQQHDNTMAGGYMIPKEKFSVLVQRLQRAELFGKEVAIQGLMNIGTAIEDQRNLSSVWERVIKSEISILASSTLTLDSEHILIAGASSGGDSTSVSQESLLLLLDSTNGNTIYSRGLSWNASESRIFGLCKNDDTDGASFFAVGTTNGYMYGTEGAGPADPTHVHKPSQAFLAKIERSTLAIEWLYLVRGKTLDQSPPQVHGLSCSVTPDGALVYMAGNVKPGSAYRSMGTHQ
jgi:hypothetical protein